MQCLEWFIITSYGLGIPASHTISNHTQPICAMFTCRRLKCSIGLLSRISHWNSLRNQICFLYDVKGETLLAMSLPALVHPVFLSKCGRHGCHLLCCWPGYCRFNALGCLGGTTYPQGVHALLTWLGEERLLHCGNLTSEWNMDPWKMYFKLDMGMYSIAMLVGARRATTLTTLSPFHR